MKEILAKLKEAVEICEVRINKVNEDRQINESNAKKNAEEADRLKDLALELSDKEKEIKKSEFIVMTMKQVSDERKKLNDAMNVLKTNQEKLVVDQQSHERKVEDDKAENQRVKDKLLGERQKLELDKKNYKKEVLAEIDKSVKNKLQ